MIWSACSGGTGSDQRSISGTTAIAYETVTAADGSLPLLTPMSEVAGRLSIQAGAYALQKANGGSGKLLGGECLHRSPCQTLP